MLAVFLIGRRADAAQHARLQRGLQEVRRIHGAARGRARADHGVDLVDEQDRAGIGLDLLHDGLQPLLEVAAIARSGKQRAHVEREHGCVREHLRHLAAHDLARQPFRDGRLADAGIADIKRVVLRPAAKHLDGPLNLLVAADQRIDAAILRLLVEVDAISLERVRAALLVVRTFHCRRVLINAAHATGLGHPRAFGDAVRNEVHRVEAGHVLLLQEICRVALPLREDGDENIGAGHLFAAGRLHMNDGAMNDALEARRGLRFAVLIEDQIGQLFIEKIGQLGSQALDIDITGPHHG